MLCWERLVGDNMRGRASGPEGGYRVRGSWKTLMSFLLRSGLGLPAADFTSPIPLLSTQPPTSLLCVYYVFLQLAGKYRAGTPTPCQEVSGFCFIIHKLQVCAEQDRN